LPFFDLPLPELRRYAPAPEIARLRWLADRFGNA
jgi:hypothetical protein